MKIRLTNHELIVASTVGMMRRVSSLRHKMQPAAGLDMDALGWDRDIEGVCGEICVAKTLNMYWEPRVNNFHGADIGNNIQVRTRSKDHYELIVRKNDNPEHFYFLVTGSAPDYTVHGYIIGKFAMKEEWLADHGDRPEAWFVPQAELTAAYHFTDASDARDASF